MECIAFDSHKRYTFASVSEQTGKVLSSGCIDRCRGAILCRRRGFRPLRFGIFGTCRVHGWC